MLPGAHLKVQHTRYFVSRCQVFQQDEFCLVKEQSSQLQVQALKPLSQCHSLNFKHTQNMPSVQKPITNYSHIKLP